MAKQNWYRAPNRLHDPRFKSLVPSARAVLRDLDELLSERPVIEGKLRHICGWIALNDRKVVRKALATIQASGLMLIRIEGDRYRIEAPADHPAKTKGRLPAEMWKRIRASILQRDRFTCQYCGAQGVQMECDHIVPISKGGDNDPSNLVAACVPCNRSKGAKSVEEWLYG